MNISKLSDLGKEPRPQTAPIVAADRVNRFVVAEAEAGQRLDNFLLRHCKGVPKSHVYRVIRSGEVRINGKRADPEARLAIGDELRIPPIRIAQAPERGTPPDAAFAVLYEDDELLVVDKPSGVAVHGGSGVSFGVIEQLRAARPTARFLELVHRLDKDTSGVLLLAKKRAALVAMHAQLQAGTTDKRYVALVHGRVDKQRQHVKATLLKSTGANGERHVRVVDARSEGAQTAHTVIESIERFAAHWPLVHGATLVEAQLKTGRTHQIRVHLAHLQHPILGDGRYGDFALNKTLTKIGLRRMFLHARSFAFTHPRSGEALQIEAALPPECERVLETLRAATL